MGKCEAVLILALTLCGILLGAEGSRRNQKPEVEDGFETPTREPEDLVEIIAGSDKKKLGGRYCYRVARVSGTVFATLISRGYHNYYDTSYKSCNFYIIAPENQKVKMTCAIAIPHCHSGQIDVYKYGNWGRRQRICGSRRLQSYDVTSTGNLMFLNILGTNMKYSCKFEAIGSSSGGSSAIQACGVSSKTTKIVGGTAVRSAEVYPWQARLVYKPRDDTYCGGSLINQDWVVTAAHCIIYAAQETQVVVGDLVISRPDGEVKRDVASFTKHQGYRGSDGDFANDIAVIKLRSPVSYSTTIRPICLPCNYLNQDFTGDVLTLAGWGHDEYGGVAQDTLHEVSVPIVSNSACERRYGEVIKPTSLCAGETQGGKDSCQGDSGGPGIWVHRDISYLVGVISVGIGCAQAETPGIYTRVTKYIPWIQQKTGVSFCS